MNTMILSAEIPILMLCAVPIFVILFVTIARTLSHIPLFADSHTVALALCVTLLCMIGLYRTFVQPAGAEAATPNDADRSLDFLLLPYTAMALAMLCVLLLLFMQRLLRRREPAHLYTDLAKRRPRIDALRKSPKHKVQDSVYSSLLEPHENSRSGPSEDPKDLNKIRTDLKNKEILS